MSRRYQPLNARHAATIAELARSMRHSPSASVQVLWAHISGSRLGVSFKRQYVVGTFFADFAAPARRLIVEVDGNYHTHRSLADEARDTKLRRLGWRVLRIASEVVLRNPSAAVSAVSAALACNPSEPIRQTP